jgi:hypothetical protein
MASNYIQKPPIVSAVQYDGTNAQDVISFANGKITDEGGKLMLAHYPEGMPSEVNITDWVIKGPAMVISSMVDSLFSVAYEPTTLTF